MGIPSGGAPPNCTAEQPPPPLTQRRPRVREVHSRFLNSTPIPNPNAFPRSKSTGNREPPPISDENQIPPIEKPSSILSTVQRKLNLKRQSHHHPDSRVSSRPDTPVATGRSVSSRYRQLPSSNGSDGVTSAVRLLHEATLSNSSEGSSSSCPNSPLCGPSSKLRNSMPDVDKWLTDRSSCKTGSDCARSLSFLSSAKTGGGISLPPHPSLSINQKTGRKVSSHTEDIHCLKILNNRNLQWRFAIAKAGVSFDAVEKEAEKSFLSLNVKIMDMRDNVQKKRKELAALRRVNTLNTIVKAQIQYLDEWASLDKDYSTSLLDTTDALLNCSARLPVSRNVQAEVGEVDEALSSALKAVEMIGSQIQRFMPKAVEIDSSVSELARIAGGERALIEECGDLISNAYVSQVKECSLRSTLMQVGNNNRYQKQKSEDDTNIS